MNTSMEAKPREIIFYPMAEGQGWYIVGVYNVEATSEATSGEQPVSATQPHYRTTLAELSAQIGLDLAHRWAAQLDGFTELADSTE